MKRIPSGTFHFDAATRNRVGHLAGRFPGAQQGAVLAREPSLARLGYFFEELTGVGGSFAGVFVFEIDVDIDSLVEPGVEALPPCF